MADKNHNIGDCNTGDYNTGDCNTGDYNTGYRNTGYRNTGDYNTGDYNTGDCNTGDYNTGDYNTGYRNTGYYNTGNRNIGYCNTNTPKLRMFNKDTEIEFESDLYYEIYKRISTYQKPLCEWVSSANMTKEERKANSTYETTQGYLKVNETTYNGNDVTAEDEAFFRGLPNFDEAIFAECTGIDLTKKTVKITIDGKDIQVSKEEFENIKAQFLRN